MKTIVGVVLSLLFVSSCTSLCGRSHEDMQPEDVVEAYLDIALNMQSIDEKQSLMEYTTGNLKEAIAKASDATIMEAYVNKNFSLERYSVVERRDRTPKETEITFALVYRELGSDPKADPAQFAQITTENTIRVIRENKLWLISDVLNKKSSFDFPLAMQAEIKPCKEGEVTPENKDC